MVQRRSPDWINSTVIVQALSLKAQGILSPLLERWITDLLELTDQESFPAANPHK